MRHIARLFVLVLLGGAGAGVTPRWLPAADKACLERVAAEYHAAWLAHDPTRRRLARKVRFVENNVELTLADGSWDTVSEAVGTPLVLSDPKTGNVGMYTTVLQSKETQTYCRDPAEGGGRAHHRGRACALHQAQPQFAAHALWGHLQEPARSGLHPHHRRGRARHEGRTQAPGQRIFLDAREQQRRNPRRAFFSGGPRATKTAMNFPEIEKGFKSGRYGFNNRVRDRECLVVDEERSAVMCRGFIDHKGAWNTCRSPTAPRRSRCTRNRRLGLPGVVQGEERHDHCGGGHLHRRALLHQIGLSRRSQTPCTTRSSAEGVYHRRMNTHPPRPFRRHSLWRDLAVATAAAALVATIAAATQFSEKLFTWSRGFEYYQLDEWPIALLAFTISMVVLYARRHMQLRRALEDNRQLAERLVAVQEQERRNIGARTA